MTTIASVVTTRNITLTICFLFALSAFGLARVSPAFFLGLAGWILAGLQTFRLDVLKNNPEHKPRGQITDIILTILITILLSSLVHAILDLYRIMAESGPVNIQTTAYQILVLGGGWALSWLQSVRRIRLALAYARGKSS